MPPKSVPSLPRVEVIKAVEHKSPLRFLIDTFDRSDGGLCLAAGNGILPGTPLENVQAFLEEALEYGKRHRQIKSQI